MMTCSLCETGLNFRCHNFPQTPSWQILGGSGEIIIFCPPKQKNYLGDFLGELISVSPPNIEIGVRGDLDYSPGQSLLVRRDLT